MPRLYAEIRDIDAIMSLLFLHHDFDCGVAGMVNGEILAHVPDSLMQFQHDVRYVRHLMHASEIWVSKERPGGGKRSHRAYPSSGSQSKHHQGG